MVAGGSFQEPQPSVGSALQTVAAHASVFQDALLQVSMPAIAGLALGRPKATPATRLTVDFGAVGQASASAERLTSPSCAVVPEAACMGPLPSPWTGAPSKGFSVITSPACVLLLTLAMCRNAWPHIFRGHRQWNVTDARASHRYGDFARYAQHFVCSMFQPSTWAAPWWLALFRNVVPCFGASRLGPTRVLLLPLCGTIC